MIRRPDPSSSAPAGPLGRALDAERRLLVRQRRDWLEAFTDFERANRYALLTESGALVGWALERPGGLWRFLARSVLKAMRPFEIVVFPPEGPAAPAELTVRRPWTWFLARVHVWGRGGRPLGLIRQRWTWIRRRLDVEAPDGRTLARITGPLLRPWTFLVERGPESSPREVGRIEKRWGGLLEEALTDADTYAVTFGDSDPVLRRLLLAAALLVDCRWFEGRD